MKKLFIVLISVLLLVIAGPSLAAKPSPKSILHCGCVLDEFGAVGVDMVYHEIEVSGNSGGHKRHLVTTTDDCGTGVYEEVEPFAEITQEWMRTGKDCLISGTDNNIELCEEFLEVPYEGLSCGGLVSD
jgi:hypothetical protein